jgi:hypothetical protein
MALLLSNKQPAYFPNIQNSNEVFVKYLKDCDSLKIATGYISADSLIELSKIVEINHKPKIELMIGMHYFDGFTRPQYEAAQSLNLILNTKNLGGIYLSNTRKFHGKMYSFNGNEISPAFMIGSSNLDSCISKNPINYEADILLTDEAIVQNYTDYLTAIIKSLSVPFETIIIDKFIEKNSLLENQYGVDKVDLVELAELKNNLTNIKFEIPIKTEPKSNLNAFFGKGRVNNRGFETPRPWYEVELIVSNSITQANNYPYCQEFDVITDDGWKFRCKTSGDFSKNFRSNDDLKILGKWIKGRLENSNCLKVGEPVTERVLRNYGRTNIELIKTKKEDVWYLNFNS